MTRLQKIEVSPDGSTVRSVLYIDKSSLISISENVEMSSLLEASDADLSISTLLYSMGDVQKMVDVVGTPDSIYRKFGESQSSNSKSRRLIHG